MSLWQKPALSEGGDDKAKTLSRSLLGVLEEQHGGQGGLSREREGQERTMSEEKLMAIKTWTLALKGFEQRNNVIMFNTILL